MSIHPIRLVTDQSITLTHPADIAKDISPRDLQKARVLFINMPLRESAAPVDAPEGPLLLATNLIRKYGVETTIVDLNAYRVKDEEARRRNLPNGRHLTYPEAYGLIVRHIQQHGIPILVGLSGKITTLRWQQYVAKIARELMPEAFIVSGNGLATELKNGLFTYIPELDGACSSEGDDVIVKIVYDAVTIRTYGLRSAIESGKLKPYYLGHFNGRHRFFYIGYRPRDLDAIHFADMDLLESDVQGNPVRDWYLKIPVWGIGQNNSSATPWEDGQVTPKTNSVSSRGCPFGCHYCFRGANGERKWTIRSAQHIYEELVHNQERYGIKFHGFHDDNFAVQTQRIKEMVPLIKPLNIWWGTHTRLDEIADIKFNTGQVDPDPRVKYMAEAGCKYIGFGPESASASVLQAIGKGGHTLTNGFTEVMVDGKPHEFPRSMIEGIRNALRFGIHSNCTWIVGSPTETLEDVKKSVRFILWQTEEYERYGTPAHAVNQKMFTMTWYPGTALINNTQVREVLTEAFHLNFVSSEPSAGGALWEPVIDDNFYRYLIELDDATKVLKDSSIGKPLHFSDMTQDEFLRVRECIDGGRLFSILTL